MNYQNLPRKSLGTLYRAEKTKPRSPDMTGTLKIQMHTLRELFEFYRRSCLPYSSLDQW